jgi:hypothetical protein
MERRDFLQLGVAGGASIALGGCASKPAAPPTASSNVDDFLHNVDQGLASIAVSTPLTELLVKSGKDPATLPPASLARGEQLFKNTLSALLVSASFRDLSREEQQDPRVQDVMWRSMGVMDDAVLGVADHLERLTPDERRAIGDELRAKPTLAHDVFESVDSRAAKAGIGSNRRLQLRSIASHVSWRLRSQPVSLFIDQHVDKVRTLAERENKKVLAEIATAPPPEGAELKPKSHSGEKVATVGATLLGISVVVGLAGGAIAGASTGTGVGVGLVMFTVGALGAIGGLVTLLVGLIMMAAA